MDRITKSMVEAFKKSLSLETNDECLLFEQFSNYCVISSEYGLGTFDISEITTGSNAPGIDGMAIIVNGRLATTVDDINHLIEMNHSISVKFILIQSKTSAHFNGADIANFLSCSLTFFNDGQMNVMTPELQKFIELKDHIFGMGDKLTENPRLHLYYVTLGSSEDTTEQNSIISNGVKSLKQTNLFSNVGFYSCGSAEIQNMYRKTKTRLSASFKFERKITMFSNADNTVGYCGVIPFREFKNLILDGETIKPVFEDNIRDYLGIRADVNQNISETIRNGDVSSFCLLNNGITIVASRFNITGDDAYIEDYQIVNGCQTSNVLIQNMSTSPNIDNLIIPIRIIATEDENLKNEITRATNNQTSIKKEQLEALSTFQKQLEEYYKTFASSSGLVYERRTGQHRETDIPRNKIVTISRQIKAISAMFLNEPSAISGQYGTVAKRVGNKIFKTSDRLIMYYTSALTLYKLEILFSSNKIDRTWRRSRYHVMMLFRIIMSKNSMPHFNSNKMESYCNNLLNILNNDEQCEAIFTHIVDFIKQDTEVDISDRKCFEKQETKEYLLSKVSELSSFLKGRGVNVPDTQNQ